ncbi:MAG TPA: phosphotransferase [Stellaceae bacterium]|jgi:predicted hotdog family 3-hydroxylacyl-ACP dehydratase|nr:phosphotransferase [Stellaceae bacterium]
MIERAAIATLIPHAGKMCLLDRVVSWDEQRITCESNAHRDPDNPLRRDGRLGALTAIEFAAQAMAAHGRLAGAVSERPRAGFIASLRDVQCRCAWLDRFDAALEIGAIKLMGDEHNVMYAFAVACGTQEIVTGRATVVLQAGLRP